MTPDKLRARLDLLEFNLADEDDRSVSEYRDHYPAHVAAIDALRDLLDWADGLSPVPTYVYGVPAMVSNHMRAELRNRITASLTRST